MLKIEHYKGFNYSRYSNPWVALVKDGSPDFSTKVGGYTGGYNAGEEGDLYINNPIEGAVYMYGQKDRRGNNTERKYIIIINGAAVPCNKLGEPKAQ